MDNSKVASELVKIAKSLSAFGIGTSKELAFGDSKQQAENWHKKCKEMMNDLTKVSNDLTTLLNSLPEDLDDVILIKLNKIDKDMDIMYDSVAEINRKYKA